MLPIVLWSLSNASWLHSKDGDGSGSRGIKSQCCSHPVAAPNHAHGTRLSAEIQVRGFTVDNKSDEALLATAGQLPLGKGGEFLVDQSRIFDTSNRENFTDMFFHSLHKRRNSGSASVLSQYASGRTTSNSKHSQVPSPQVQPSLVSLHWFREPVLLPSCALDATCSMTGADGPNSA